MKTSQFPKKMLQYEFALRLIRATTKLKEIEGKTKDILTGICIDPKVTNAADRAEKNIYRLTDLATAHKSCKLQLAISKFENRLLDGEEEKKGGGSAVSDAKKNGAISGRNGIKTNGKNGTVSELFERRLLEIEDDINFCLVELNLLKPSHGRQFPWNLMQ